MTSWDYTDLAPSYLHRPGYADAAVAHVLARAGLGPAARVCDVGAGTATLTLALAKSGARVTAIEPNAAMRSLGVERTSHLPGSIAWSAGTAEATGQAAGAFDLVTFGSSFNVTDRPAALRETARILAPGGWLAALWNHRDLDDPLQRRIEDVITAALPGYDYGTRREDQTGIIAASGAFGPVERFEARVVHVLPASSVVAAWRSHATLRRQAGARFDPIVAAIATLLPDGADTAIPVPYTTRVWMAPVLAHARPGVTTEAASA